MVVKPSVRMLESPSAAVAEFLVNNGLRIGYNSPGRPNLHYSSAVAKDHLDVYSGPGLQRSVLKTIFPSTEQIPDFFGTIWFANAARNSTYDHWVFDFYYEGNTDNVRRFLNGLSKKFKVNITARLLGKVHPGFAQHDQ